MYIKTLTKDVMLLFFFLVSAVHNQSVTAASYCPDSVLLEPDGDIFIHYKSNDYTGMDLFLWD
jgi:hypothetical protein